MQQQGPLADITIAIQQAVNSIMPDTLPFSFDPDRIIGGAVTDSDSGRWQFYYIGRPHLYMEVVIRAQDDGRWIASVEWSDSYEVQWQDAPALARLMSLIQPILDAIQNHVTLVRIDLT